MKRTACMSLSLLFSCIAFMMVAPSYSHSQKLTAAGLTTDVGTDEGTIIANVASESLSTSEADVGLGASNSASNMHSSHVFMVAGTGELGFRGDGGLATGARLWFATSVVVDVGGNIVIADSFNNRVRRVDARTGKIETVAGTGQQGFSGDGDLATGAQLNSPSGVAIDHQGNIVIADTFNNRIRLVDARTGIISTLAGTGEQGGAGDDGLAVRAQLAGPTGIAVDPDGNLVIADSANHRIRKVDRAKNVIVSVAGSGVAGMSGDGAFGVQAELNNPTGVAVDGNGNILIADTVNNRVRRMDATSGIISTVAGTGDEGFKGDGERATRAQLMQPSGITVDAEGAIYVSDTFNNRIRRIDPVSGIITTLVGTEIRGHSINGMAATRAPLNNPMGITRDPLGNLVVADSGNHCILRIMP